MRSFKIMTVAMIVFVWPIWAGAHDRSREGGRVNQLKVLSDKIDDVTTVENIVKSFAKPGTSDQERAKGLWKAIIRHRHQTTPPNEHLAGDWEAHDPVKILRWNRSDPPATGLRPGEDFGGQVVQSEFCLPGHSLVGLVVQRQDLNLAEFNRMTFRLK
jgi:hypothetical protein